MHPDAEEIGPAHAAAVNAAVAAAPRFCPHCGATEAAAEHPCRPPAPIHPHAPHTAWHDLLAVRGALLLYFSIIAASALGVIAAAARMIPNAQTEVAAEIGASLAVALVILVACVRSRPRLRPVLRTAGHAQWYVIAPIAALGTFGLANIACGTIGEYFNLPQVGYSEPYLYAGWGWWLPILVVCVMPAIFEELAFRGVMTSSLQPVLGRRDTLFVVALLFAIIHLNPFGFVHLFVAGVALGILRNVSGSLYPGMLLHFCHNGLALLLEATR